MVVVVHVVAVVRTYTVPAHVPVPQGAKRVSELHKGSSGNSGIFKEYISRRKGGARGKGAGADSTQQQGSTSTKESKRKKAFEMAELATLST